MSGDILSAAIAKAEGNRMTAPFADILTAREAAAALGIHDRTLRKWVTAGRVKPLRPRQVQTLVFTQQEIDRVKALPRGDARRRRML